MAVGASMMGRLRRVRAPAGITTCPWEPPAFVLGDEVQLPAGGLAARTACDRAPVTREIDLSGILDPDGHLTDRMIVAVDEDRAVESDDILDGRTWTDAVGQVGDPALVEVEPVDDALAPDADELTGEPQGQRAADSEISWLCRIDPRGHEGIVDLRPEQPHRARPLRSGRIPLVRCSDAYDSSSIDPG